MTDPTPFSNAYDAAVPELWTKHLAAILAKNAVMLQCVNTDYEGEIKNAGDKVHIIKPGEVSITTLHGDNLSYPEIAPSDVTLTIDQKKYFAFKINDVAIAQANSSLMEAYMMNAKDAIQEAQDTYLLGLHTQADASNIVNTSLTATYINTSNIYEQFVTLAKTLKKANALNSGNTPWVIINPDIEAILLQSSQFTSSSNLSAQALREGAIGRIAGMDILVSTNLSDDANDAIPVVAGTNQAITFASQISKVEQIRDINSFSDLVRGLYLYGAKVVEPKALAVKFLTLATPST